MALSARSSLFRPASASRVAAQTPSFSLRIRVCTLPRKFSTCNQQQGHPHQYIVQIKSLLPCRLSDIAHVQVQAHMSLMCISFQQYPQVRITCCPWFFVAQSKSTLLMPGKLAEEA